jgi:hypothetical protein
MTLALVFFDAFEGPNLVPMARSGSRSMGTLRSCVMIPDETLGNAVKHAKQVLSQDGGCDETVEPIPTFFK